jgi:hypothetical protein
MKKLVLLCLLALLCGCAANDCVIVVGPGEALNEEDAPGIGPQQSPLEVRRDGSVLYLRRADNGASVEKKTTTTRAPRIL